MAKLTSADITRTARLANLTLTKRQIEKFQKELSKVVEYIARLSKVDTSKVDAATRSTQLINVVRHDKINPSRYIDREIALSESLKSHNNFFTVPLIIKTKDVKD